MKEHINLLFKAFTIGIKISAIVSLMIFLGIKLDNHLSIHPLFTVIFAISSILLSYILAGKAFIKKWLKEIDNNSEK